MTIVKTKFNGRLYYNLLQLNDKLAIYKMDFSDVSGNLEPVMCTAVALFPQEEKETAEKFFDSL